MIRMFIRKTSKNKIRHSALTVTKYWLEGEINTEQRVPVVITWLSGPVACSWYNSEYKAVKCLLSESCYFTGIPHTRI
jgi:hypothetical protein